MASAFGGRAAADELRRDHAAGRVQVADAGTAAWLLAVPVALLGAALVAVLGPPLGDLLSPSHPPFTYWSHLAFAIHPEPTEQARYLLAIAVALLYPLAVVALVRRAPRLPAQLVALGVPLAQALAALAVVVCMVAQYRITYGELYSQLPEVTYRRVYFTPATLAFGVLFASAVAAVLHSERASARFAALVRETRARRIAMLALAILLTAIWLLHAVNSDRSIALEISAVRDHLEYQLNETFAVLDGRTPLVDFTSQYGSLWPFAFALWLLAFGKTLLAFTIANTLLTSVAMLAIFGVLRRVSRSSAVALLLYLPFLATSFFLIAGTLTTRYTFGAYFGAFPLRYAGPFLLAWLVARRLERGDERARAWPIFLAAGLTILNNTEFGIPALAATVAALAWTLPSFRREPLLRLLGAAAAGLLAALALVSVLTLARAGELPQLSRLVEFARIFARGGFGMLPLPEPLGLHLVIYLTYVAAIGTATVRALERAPNRVLTGMLAWTGVFGLGAASYYMGRSHSDSLISTFSPWALALALLSVHCAAQVAASARRLPGIAALLVFAGLGVTVCSLAQTPTPWGQLRRITSDAAPAEGIARTPLAPDPATRAFYSSSAYGPHDFYAKPGAPVVILTTSGHRVADAFGVVNVSQYSGLTSAVTQQQLEAEVAALRRAGGNTLMIPTTANEDYEVLARADFALVTRSGLQPYDGESMPPDDTEVTFPPGTLTVPWKELTVTKWVDTHNLHPRFLRSGRGAPVLRIG